MAPTVEELGRERGNLAVFLVVAAAAKPVLQRAQSAGRGVQYTYLDMAGRRVEARGR